MREREIHHYRRKSLIIEGNPYYTRKSLTREQNSITIEGNPYYRREEPLPGPLRARVENPAARETACLARFRRTTQTPVEKTLLLGEPLPSSPTAEIALQPLI